MDLDTTEEQEQLRDLARTVCADHASLEVVRTMEDDPKGFTDELWKQLGEVGLLGLTIPEEFGGSGQGLLEAMVVYEEFGRALVPSPHFPSCVLSAGVLARAGDDALKQRWLPALANGDAILTPAWIEPGNGWEARGVQLRAEPSGEGTFRLRGTKRHVPFASSADRLVVLARSGEAETELDLFLVDPRSEGVRLTQQKSMASDTQYRVDLDVEVSEADRIGSAGSGWQTWNATMLEAIVALAAQAVGGTDRALELTVAYAKEREQFGKPIGAFQALSHYLADAATRLDAARTLVAQAAWLHSVGQPIDAAAPMAKLFACDTFRDATAACQQIWGGVGFTVEYDIQLYFRRAKQLQITWWDSATLEERIAQSELD